MKDLKKQKKNKKGFDLGRIYISGGLYWGLITMQRYMVMISKLEIDKLNSGYLTTAKENWNLWKGGYIGILLFLYFIPLIYIPLHAKYFISK